MLLLSGIANPKPIETEIKSKIASYQTLRFKDHHNFHITDLEKIKKEFSKMDSSNKIILTTEKDATRLFRFEDELKDFPIYVLPMAHQFLFEEDEIFNKIIFDFVESFEETSMDVSA